eukprot:TRINITY_DN6207_c0_g1_i4.p1 TRINITY_DN6207_c0_g1~~TRINITY_DN6207_c0_g1_i4.p1  ORF type:complete len:112 (+),score=18.55 TRINITY_DN6207_c0_g1_i4:491-826(+)
MTDGNRVPASEAFAVETISLIGHADIDTMLELQQDMQVQLNLASHSPVSLENFEASNEALLKINEFSSKEFRRLEDELEKHTRLMKEMKRDLEYIFVHLKTIRRKLQTNYP